VDEGEGEDRGKTDAMGLVVLCFTYLYTLQKNFAHKTNFFMMIWVSYAILAV
jgi:hypothetical protein